MTVKEASWLSSVPVLLALIVAIMGGIAVGILEGQNRARIDRELQEVREHLDRLQSQVDKLPGNRP